MKARLAQIPENLLADEKAKNMHLNFTDGLHRKAEELFKQEKCELCGSKLDTVNKSHCLPKFILKEISNGGLIKLGQDLSGFSRRNKKYSISQTLIFKNICSKCDNDFFKDYENQNLFTQPINDLILNEIAAKNCLRYIYKNDLRILFNKNIIENYPFVKKDIFENQKFLAEIDAAENRQMLRKIIKNKNESLFYLIDQIDLPYKTLMAFQGSIALQCGFDGDIINDTHNYDPKYKIQSLDICVFPHDKGTKILLFCKHGFNRLRKFYKKYRHLTLDQKLYCINYIILLESEEWFVKWDFDDSRINDETKKLIATVDQLEILTKRYEDFKSNRDAYIKKANDLVKEKFIIKTDGNIFNFLAKHED